MESAPISRVMRHAGTAILILLALPWAIYLRLFTHRVRRIWLIGERSDQACDNGWHLFSYARRYHPEEPICYIISRNSTHLKQLQPLGNVIYYGSVRHYAFWLASHRLVCAHLSSCVPDEAVCWRLEPILKKRLGQKKIYVKHGIDKEDIPSHYYQTTKVDLLVCGAVPEYQFVLETFGYPLGAVQCLGLPRFDALMDSHPKRQILLMPTWRKWLRVGTTWGKVNEESIQEFINSDYYRSFHSLLDNVELTELLLETEFKLVFYLHHELQGVTHLFKNPNNCITIADQSGFDVQELLKESAILVTDYSSIAFDFAYMNKPLIYYQFDREAYNARHYAKGYFDYERDGFGPVVETVPDLLGFLGLALQQGLLHPTPAYSRRIEAFFGRRDTSNCKRVYQAIREL